MSSYRSWYIPALILIVLTAVYFFLVKPKGSYAISGDSNTYGDIPLQSHKEGEEEISASMLRQQKLMGTPWVRNPFDMGGLKRIDKAETKESKPEFVTMDARLLDIKLTGIVFFDNQYMALINDTGVKVGENILDFKVVEIKRQYIVLADRLGKKFTIELK